MAINTISYTNKSDINTTTTPVQNKISSSDMNEIKSVVNANATLMGDLTNLNTTDKTSIVNAINEINSKTSIYSSNEFKTNEVWIDGRTIYRKTFTLNIGTATTFSLAHGISVSNTSNIWVDIGNSFFSTSAVSQSMGHYSSNDDYSRIYLTPASINCSFGSVYSTISKTAYITIKYIKEGV